MTCPISHLSTCRRDTRARDSGDGRPRTELGLKASPRLRDFCSQAQAEVVSNSRNRILQIWGPPFSQSCGYHGMSRGLLLFRRYTSCPRHGDGRVSETGIFRIFSPLHVVPFRYGSFYFNIDDTCLDVRVRSFEDIHCSAHFGFWPPCVK